MEPATVGPLLLSPRRAGRSLVRNVAAEGPSAARLRRGYGDPAQTYAAERVAGLAVEEGHGALLGESVEDQGLGGQK